MSVSEIISVGFGIASMSFAIGRFFRGQREKFLEDQRTLFEKKIDEITNDRKNCEISNKTKDDEYCRQIAEKDTEISRLKSQIRTITCKICGSGVKRIGERKEHSQHRSTPYYMIDLQCTGSGCGQKTEINREMLENMMRDLSGQP